MSIGDALAQARSQAGLTIAQVAQRTCIRETIVRDIERGDFSACGGDFYARGHIRSIARSVGLDPDELIREYDATHGAPQAITAADVFEPTTPIKLKERRSINWSAGMVLALLVVLGYGGFRLLSPGAPAHHAAAAGTAGHSRHHRSAASAAKASPTASAPVSHKVVIQATALSGESCWIEFLRPSGRYISQTTVYYGSPQTWTFHHRIVMKLGNSGGITLTVNGKNLGTPGTVGVVKTLTFGPGRPLPSQAAGG